MATASKESTVAASYVSGVIQYVLGLGFDSEALLRNTGIDQEQVADKSARITAESYIALFRNAEQLTSDPTLGLKIGATVKPGNYGVIGYVIMACRNFGEALERAGRYQKLVGDIGYSDIVIEEEHAEVRWLTEFDSLPDSIVEEHIASIYTYSRWITGQDKNPSAVLFQHNKHDVVPYEAYFGCPVYFSQPYTGVRFPLSYADIPLPQYDLNLCNWLDKKAAAELQAFEAGNAFIEQIKKVVRNALPDGPPTLRYVSGCIGLTEKSLQRELGSHDLSYKKLLDSTRHQLAIGYIANQTIELQELAFLLGFSEQSAFQRAFKRWTGTTPGKYRKSLDEYT